MKKNLFVVLAVVAGILVVAGSLMLSDTSPEEPLTAIPSEIGDTEIENEELWTVDVRTKTFAPGEGQVVFTVQDGKGRPLPGPLVTVTVQKPSKKGYHRTHGGMASGNGVYSAAVRFPGSGEWDLAVYVFLNGRSITHTERVTVR
jgi:hypothetical protein